MVNPYKKFIGKKLLLLGTNVGTSEIVNYAKSQGAHVIVTDNLPPEKSTAKLIADEAWQISTSDVDSLEKLAVKNKINGVFAGASEFNIEKALTLCERLDLPFYCNRKQWDICSNKRHFKQLCQANGIPVAREYKIDEDIRKIKYPVIVKPVDSDAGKGIRICQNEHALLESYHRAISLSITKKAIIEEFINGDEFNAGYFIQNGKFGLTYTVDKYLNSESAHTIIIPHANILPSKYTGSYLKELNNEVIKMFQSIGLVNGFIFVQAKVNNSGFHFFEANFRLGGGSFHRYSSKLNGVNHMEMLVNYALTGKMESYDLSLDNPNFNTHCCSIDLISKGGKVGKIIGLEDVLKRQNVIAVVKTYNIGDYIEKSGTSGQIILRIMLMEDTMQELKNCIKEIQSTVKVLDDKGNNMLLPPFDTDRI